MDQSGLYAGSSREIIAAPSQTWRNTENPVFRTGALGIVEARINLFQWWVGVGWGLPKFLGPGLLEMVQSAYSLGASVREKQWK